MRIKTSVTLPEELLRALDGLGHPYKNRSQAIEAATRSFVAQKHRESRDAKDLSILDRTSDQLNREALDVLSYQVPV